MTRAELIETIKACYGAILEAKVLVVESADEKSSAVLDKMNVALEKVERALGDEHAQPQ